MCPCFRHVSAYVTHPQMPIDVTASAESSITTAPSLCVMLFSLLPLARYSPSVSVLKRYRTLALLSYTHSTKRPKESLKRFSKVDEQGGARRDTLARFLREFRDMYVRRTQLNVTSPSKPCARCLFELPYSHSDLSLPITQ